MEQNIQQCLVTYFKTLEKHNLFCQDINETFISVLNRIRVKDRNLDLIKRSEIHEFKQLDDIKERVIGAILLDIDELVCAFKSMVKTLEKSTTELRNKLDAFSKSVVDYEFPENSPLTNGTALQPALSKILESANDSWLYYHGYLTGIEIDVECADFKNEKTVGDMIEYLSKDKSYKNIINNILMLTQFCSQNNLLDAV